MKNVVILFDDVLCLLITLVNDSLDLAVNGVSHLIAVGLGRGITKKGLCFWNNTIICKTIYKCNMLE